MDQPLAEIKEKGREVLEKGKKDVVSLQKFAKELPQAASSVFLQGIKHSLTFTPTILSTQLLLNDVAKPVTWKNLSYVGKMLLRFVAMIAVLGLAQDFVPEWLFWPLLLFFNEAINYQITVFFYLNNTVSGKFEDVQDVLTKRINTTSIAASRLLKSVSKQLSGVIDKNLIPDLSKDGKDDEKNAMPLKHREMRSKLLARVIVAKVMSYYLIFAYLQEVLDLLSFSTFLQTSSEVFLYALLLAYFLTENRLIIFEKMKFSERIEYLQTYFVYYFGLGLLPSVVFVMMPYGHFLCCLYHIALVCSQFNKEPVTDKRLDLDGTQVTELLCSKIVDYVI